MDRRSKIPDDPDKLPTTTASASSSQHSRPSASNAWKPNAATTKDNYRCGQTTLNVWSARIMPSKGRTRARDPPNVNTSCHENRSTGRFSAFVRTVATADSCPWVPLVGTKRGRKVLATAGVPEGRRRGCGWFGGRYDALMATREDLHRAVDELENDQLPRARVVVEDEESSERAPLPDPWRTFEDGTPQPDWTAIIRADRDHAH